MKNRIWAAIFLFLASSAPSFAQVDTAWVRRYNGPGNANDAAWVLKVDGSGNVYVTGRSIGSGTNFDYATIKYAPNGDTLWLRRLDGPGNGYDYPLGMAVDGSGNVHVTGGIYWGPFGSTRYYDFGTVKYTPSGDTLWVRYWDGNTAADHGDGASALAIDGNGNIYVGGTSNNNSGLGEMATVKYSLNGDTVWARRYMGPGTGSSVYAVAVDGLGNVCVTGPSLGAGTDFDYATIKYAPNGDTLWVRRYNGPGNGADWAGAIAVDSGGNVYVTGYSLGIGTSDDYATIKYAPNGDTLWVRRYNGPGNGSDQPTTYLHALAVDNSGKVYVTGHSPGSGTLNDYATIKYASNGDTLWVRRYNGPGNDDDIANALDVDGNGNVYVTGSSTDSGSSGDYATIKYAPNGDSLWVARYNGPGNGSDAAYALNVDANDNVYVTGFSVGAGGSVDYATIKYAPVCAATKGDMNVDASLSPADVTCILRCVFLGAADPPCVCDLCVADVTCDGNLSPSDVVVELNMVYLGAGPGC